MVSESLQTNQNAVHVWHVPLDGILSSDADMLLSQDEQERAERFRFNLDRQRFIFRRAALRHILGKYLETNPGDLRFCYNDSGKPRLESPDGSPSLNFSVSQAGSIALIAVTKTESVGVDIEALIELPDVESLAKYTLSDQELVYFQTVAANQKDWLFFSLWTCKEALVKADGRGLSMPLSEIELAFSENAVARLTSIAGDRVAAARWSLNQFVPSPGYLGVVAVESPAAIVEHIPYTALRDVGW